MCLGGGGMACEGNDQKECGQEDAEREHDLALSQTAGSGREYEPNK